MKFGIRYCNTGRYIDPAQAVALLQAAERAGFESAWTVEHIVVPGGYQSAYPYAPSPDLARLGVSRVLLPVTGAASLHGRIRGPEDLLDGRKTIQKYGDEA